ncbi:MAG: hypothetical protein IPJ30_01730 [Acidobacteria bacterium]|nr:hypothetical protein [Acidobacteriota bacterium]
MNRPVPLLSSTRRVEPGSSPGEPLDRRRKPVIRTIVSLSSRQTSEIATAWRFKHEVGAATSAAKKANRKRFLIEIGFIDTKY